MKIDDCLEIMGAIEAKIVTAKLTDRGEYAEGQHQGYLDGLRASIKIVEKFMGDE